MNGNEIDAILQERSPYTPLVNAIAQNTHIQQQLLSKLLIEVYVYDARATGWNECPDFGNDAKKYRDWFKAQYNDLLRPGATGDRVWWGQAAGEIWEEIQMGVVAVNDPQYGWNSVIATYLFHLREHRRLPAIEALRQAERGENYRLPRRYV